MWLFVTMDIIYTIPILIVMGFFLFASGPVVLALVQDTDSEHPSFVNGIYMTINFGISSIMVLLMGFLGDKIGLNLTYKLCVYASIGAIPFVMMLNNKKK